MAPVVVALHRSEFAGAVTASAGDLAELLTAGIGETSPALAHDSFEPLDVRLGVRARFGQELFRLAPGCWERPIAIVEEAKLLALALDSTLDASLGFGLADLTELVLRHMDESLQRLSAHWRPRDDRVSVWDRDATVTDEEVTAAAGDLDIASTVARCHDPERAALALHWASREPNQLAAAMDGQSASFGPVIAVRHGKDFEALPVGFMIDGLYGAMHILRAVALAEGSAQARFAAVARRRVLELISGPGALLAVNADAGGGPIVALQHVRDGLILAIDVIAAGVDGLGLIEAENRLRAFVPGATVQTTRGEMALAGDEEIARLAVVVGPEQLMILRGDEDIPVEVMSAEDLRWILSVADRTDDLAVFLLDCQNPTAEHQFSFGTFDLWETWHSNDGAFHRVGAPLSLLMFEPHHERAEWTRHAELNWLEDVLARLSLPGLAKWPTVNPDSDGAPAARLAMPSRNWAVDVAQLEDGTAVGVRFRLHTNGQVRPANIAHAIFWKLRHVGGTASALAGDTGSRRLRVALVGPVDLDGEETLQLVRSGDGYVVAFSEEFGEELLSDSAAAERRIGEMLAAELDEPDASDLVAAWVSAPAGIAVDASAPPQRARLLSSFLPPHGTFRARAERAAAAALLDADVRPGVRKGNGARDLESRQIYPVLREQFRDAIAAFNGPILVHAVLEDLERVHLARWRDEGHLGRLAALATADADIATEVAELRINSNRAARALALTVEEALRDLPTGDRVPRYLDLQRIYGIAYLLYESGMRSETIHQRVSGAELEITENYELIARSADLDFDVAAFNQAVAAANPPRRLTAPKEDDLPEESRAPAVKQVRPEIAGVDSAFREALGFGVHALLCVLDTVSCWPVDDDEPVAAVPTSDLVAYTVEATDCNQAQLERAVEWLTLRPEALQGEMLEHWELDRRAVRLASRPLVEATTDMLLLCPWAASMTRQILLGHLADGRLPWPRSALPRAVIKQLETFRRSRNVALERDVIAALANRPHLTVLGNVKKPKVLGLTALPREIDGICVDDARWRIWVIEAKDRTIALSPHQLRTAIDEFHEVGGYIDKAAANVDLIRASAAAVAEAMGVKHYDRTWEVHGLMVTRRVEPAAYAGAPRIYFCTADTVVETIDSDVLPTRAYQAVIMHGRPGRQRTGRSTLRTSLSLVRQ